MAVDRPGGWSRGSTIVLGLLLIAAGIVFLAMQYLNLQLPFDLGSVGWPIFVLAPGVVLLLIGLLLPGAPGAGLSVAGTIVTMIGLLLAYQSSTSHWTSWAYAWALVAPSAVGLGMLLWGVLHLSRDAVRSGLATLGVGLVLFLVGFGFFEGVLNLGGQRGFAPLGRQALPLALIVAGVALIATRLVPRRRDEWAAAPGATGRDPVPPGPVSPSPSDDPTRPPAER